MTVRTVPRVRRPDHGRPAPADLAARRDRVNAPRRPPPRRGTPGAWPATKVVTSRRWPAGDSEDQSWSPGQADAGGPRLVRVGGAEGHSLPSSHALSVGPGVEDEVARGPRGRGRGFLRYAAFEASSPARSGEVDQPLGVGVEPAPGGLPRAVAGRASSGSAPASPDSATGPTAWYWPTMLTGCLRAQEGEQVDQFLVAHRLGQPFGHQRDFAELAVLDVAGPDRHPLALGRLEDEPVGRILDDQAGEDPAVGQGEDVDR